MIEARDWTWKASLKSEKYQGNFLLTSAIRPPNKRPVLWRETSSWLCSKRIARPVLKELRKFVIAFTFKLWPNILKNLASWSMDLALFYYRARFTLFEGPSSLVNCRLMLMFHFLKMPFINFVFTLFVNGILYKWGILIQFFSAVTPNP